MKINNWPSAEDFRMQEGIFCGQNARLITPARMDVKWTPDNIIFRSSVWSENKELLSAGFKKFPNLGEQPEVFPIPEHIRYCSAVEKIDGSLMICDFVNGMFSMRTRGTFSHSSHENAKDFDYVWNKYDLQRICSEHGGMSLLFEIVSPNNKIVLDYGKEPDIYLVGAVAKDDYVLFQQCGLDMVASKYGVKRPNRYHCLAINDLVKLVKSLPDKEGCCLYSNFDQSIHKIKSDHYLELWRMKNEMGGINNLIDRFFAIRCPSEPEIFYQDLANNYDFEIAEASKTKVWDICGAWRELSLQHDMINKFVSELAAKTDNRKAQAEEVQLKLGKNQGVGFTYLSGKRFSEVKMKKFLKEILKKD